VKLSVFFLSSVFGVSALAACSSADDPFSSDAARSAQSEDADDDARTETSRPGYKGSKYGDGGTKKPAPVGPDGGTVPDEEDASLPSGCREAYTRREVAALLAARCAPCHTESASGQLSFGADFRTSTVGVPSTQVPGMNRIQEGDKERSYLFHKLRGTHATVGGTGARMPRGGAPLTDEEIAKIGAFIDAL